MYQALSRDTGNTKPSPGPRGSYLVVGVRGHVVEITTKCYGKKSKAPSDGD